MLRVIITHFRKKWRNVRFVVATAGDIADEHARTLGLEPLRLFDKDLSLRQTIDLIKPHDICASVTVGADVLDGSYSPEFSGRLLMLTDMLARRGVACVVTGFSISKTPYKKLKLVLDEFCDTVVFNLRDPVSLGRFTALTQARANLVADIAFLLEPETGTKNVNEIKNWIDGQRTQARKIVGLNLHPLLLEPRERSDHNIHLIIQNFSETIQEAIKSHKISVVLLEHDFRGPSSDHHYLDRIESILDTELRDSIFRPKAQLSAAELKGVVGYMDGVVSGRMHLMIATFGAGTPVLGIEYKGKMEGLMNHYGLGRAYLSTAHEIINAPDEFRSRLTYFIENISSIQQQLVATTPKIKELSYKNLSNPA